MRSQGSSFSKFMMATVKQHILPALRRHGIYQRLRSSSAFEIYRRFLKKKQIEDRDSETAFYKALLKGFHTNDVVYDIGANIGTKTEIFLRLGARVVAVEPDACNQEVLRSKFLRFRIFPKPVTIVGLAVSERDGVETMWIDGDGSALNTLSQKWVVALKEDKKRFEHTDDPLEFGRKMSVETTTLDRLIGVHGSPFYIKIDVEGNELSVLRGLHLAVPYLSFEVNLPEFRQEGLECVNELLTLSVDGMFNYAVDCRRGLEMDSWLDADHFHAVLNNCEESCIEVFWRAGAQNKAGAERRRIKIPGAASGTIDEGKPEAFPDIQKG